MADDPNFDWFNWDDVSDDIDLMHFHDGDGKDGGGKHHHGGKGDGKGGDGKGHGGKDDKPTYDRDAYSMLVNEFESVGLGTLAPLILKFLQKGFGSDTITVKLQDTTEYKTRFAGNEDIKKRIQAGETGLHVLSPAEYLSQEKQYKDVLTYYGFPAGFYDDPTDFASWIGSGVSVLEVQDRARMAHDTVNGSPEIAAALRQYYPELGQGDVLAWVMDQKRAMPIIERKIQAANVGAGAAFQGLNVGQSRAEDLGAYGITADQAKQGYSAIAEALPDAEKLASLDHVEFGQSDLEDEIFKGDAAAAKKRKGLADREKARFSSSSGANQYSFTRDSGDY